MTYVWHNNVLTVYRRVIAKLHNLYDIRNNSSSEWLGQQLNAGSLSQTVDSNHRVDVSDESPDSIAGQFYTYMPGHSFKVEHLIKNLPEKHLLPLHIERTCLAIVDIGCGGATATTGLINTLLTQFKSNKRVLFIGIDNNHCAVQLYDWMMQNYVQAPVLTNEIEIEYHSVIKGMPEALTYVAEGLYQARVRWGIPSLNDLWIIQSNVVRPLHNIWEQDKAARDSLSLDAVRGLIPDDFGEVEARAYEQLLQLTEADKMMIMTVATHETQWRDSIELFGQSVNRIFEDRGHKTSRAFSPLSGQPLSVTYTNPQGSHWENYNQPYTGSFYADVEFIESQRFISDRLWQEIISIENLKLAWARVRAGMLRESLVDEVDLKVFESKLDVNIEKIRNRLLTYTIRLSDFPRIFYKVPKDKDKARPRAIQSIQEELLAVAIIQVLGRSVQELMSRNFAYRLEQGTKTEFLYRPWLRSYGSFKNAVAKTVRGSDEAAIMLRSDIESFYPSIPQEKLLETILNKFGVQSNTRVAWLLHQLIVRNEYQNLDKGVLQGPLASGFWANLYLLQLDKQFSDNYMNATFFRYVDDIVLITQTGITQNDVLADLRREIEGLGLNLSEDKTEDDSRDEALVYLERDSTLKDLDRKLRVLTNGLYFTNSTYHQQFQAEGFHWWGFVKLYQQILIKLGIFVETSRLSRKLWQYVQNPILSEASRFTMPEYSLTEVSDKWSEKFLQENANWQSDFDTLKDELSGHLKAKWQEWKTTKLDLDTRQEQFYKLAINTPEKELLKKEIKELKRKLKNYQTYISFTLNRLSRVGYENVLAEIEDIFCNFPSALKTHRLICEYLALQGHMELLHTIWQCLQSESFPGAAYLRAVILRSYRSTDITETPAGNQLLESISIMDEQNTDDSSYIEALMATETLIFTTDYRPSSTQSALFFQKANQIAELCPQLARNLYILFLRGDVSQDEYDYVRQAFEEFYEIYSLPVSSGDYSEPDFNSLNFEPDELREDFYYSRYPDNGDEFEGDYF